MEISNRGVRRIFLTIHLVASGFLGTFVYGDHFQWFTYIVVFPLLAISGLFLWQLPRFLNRFRKQA